MGGSAFFQLGTELWPSADKIMLIYFIPWLIIDSKFCIIIIYLMGRGDKLPRAWAQYY